MKLLKTILVLSILHLEHGASFPAEEDPNLFEGDMVVSPLERTNLIKNSNTNIQLAATKQPWPRVIPYDLYGLDSTPQARAVIVGAFKEYHKHTCLRFIPRTTERAYLEFSDGNGCSSMVGYVLSRKNSITLGKQCWTVGIAIHEIMHSLGFHHEQSRPDRDQYIKVHPENVLPYARNNFKKYDHTKVDSLGEPYDFESVMHYKSTTFAKHNTMAITTLDPNKQKLIGQRNGLSTLDIRQINKLYKCHQAPPMTVPIIPTLNPFCHDKYHLCKRYGHRCKLPFDSPFGKWARRDCRKTCGICNSDNGSVGMVTTPYVTKPYKVTKNPTSHATVVAACKDKLQSCNVSYCTIKGWINFVKINCRKTCRLCT